MFSFCFLGPRFRFFTPNAEGSSRMSSLSLEEKSTRKPKLGGSQSLRSFVVPSYRCAAVALARNPGINSSKFCCPSMDANSVSSTLGSSGSEWRSRVRKKEQPSHSLFSPPTNKGPDSRPPAQTMAGPFSARQGSSCLPPHFASWQLAQELGKPCPAAGLA